MQFIIFIAFTLLVGVVAYLATRKTNENTQDGYFLGGRSLTAPVIASSLLLTNLSTEQLVGLNGSAFNEGVVVMAWETLGQKSKRGPSKLLDPNIKEKMEILYEGVLDHLIMHQEDLSMSDRVKLLQSLSNYILPKTKSVRDEFTIDKLIEIKKEGVWSDTPDPTE